MCIDVRVASWLNAQGTMQLIYEVKGFSDYPTAGVFEKAAAESRVVLTVDLGFSEIVALSKGSKTGVILFRLRNTRTSFVIQ